MDDDDLQMLLAKTRQKANSKSNVALRVLEEAAEEAGGNMALDGDDEADRGLVISDLTEFVGNLSNTSALALPAVPKTSTSASSHGVRAVNGNHHTKEEYDSAVVEMEVDQRDVDEQDKDDLEEGEEKEEDDHIDVSLLDLKIEVLLADLIMYIFSCLTWKNLNPKALLLPFLSCWRREI